MDRKITPEIEEMERVIEEGRQAYRDDATASRVRTSSRNSAGFGDLAGFKFGIGRLPEWKHAECGASQI